MRIEALTPVVAGGPGDEVVARVRITNDAPTPRGFGLAVVGFEQAAVDGAALLALAADEARDIDVVLTVPEAFAAGRHALAVEARADGPGETPALAPLTLLVDTLDRVAVAVTPSTIRGRRRGRFEVELDNRQGDTLEVELGAEGQGLRVALAQRRLLVRPGERVRMRGRVRAPAHLFGETVQHVLTVVARSRSAPAYATATFRQQPLFPRGLRTAVAMLTVVALLAGLVGYGTWWWSNRDDEAEVAGLLDTVAPGEAIDLDGDGVPDGVAIDIDGDGIPDGIDVDGDGIADGIAVDTNGDGIPDGVDADGDGIPDVGPGAEGDGDGGDDGDRDGGDGDGDGGGELAGPLATTFTGTVRAGDTGENDGVTVTMAPLDLGRAPAGATAVGGGPGAALKLWPARFGRYEPAGALGRRQTESITSTATGADGAWTFGDVSIRSRYELHFAKPGFDSRAYVVTPTEDGEPVKLDVVLEPAEGALTGVVRGPNGPLGGVDLTITDGTVSYGTTSSGGEGDAGRFALEGVSTPGTYTLTASSTGYGTEVVQVTLEPGEQRELAIEVAVGVGSVGGRITANGRPLGGATVTATSGGTERTTTSLTEGDQGAYLAPKLPSPGSYTVTVSAPGYVTQSRRVELGGNARGIDFDLVDTKGAIIGRVESDQRGRLAGVGITISRDDLSFRTSTAAAPDTGAFSVGELPPGTYLVAFSRFDHAPLSTLVEVSAGGVVDLGVVLLEYRGPPQLAETGRLVVRVLDSAAAELTGATITVSSVSTGEVVRSATDAEGTQATFAFDAVPVGTYIVRVDRALYRTATRRVSIGLGQESVEFRLLRLGSALGRLVDSVTGQQLTDYEVTLYRVNADGTEDQVERAVVPAGTSPDLNGEILWQTPPTSLTTGTYRVEVTDPPPGYRVANDQIVDPTLPDDPMRFEVRPEVEDPARLNDIEADPFPTLSGRIYVPLDVDPATGAVSLRVLDASTSVTLSCPDGFTADVPAALVDEVGPDPAPETFRFDRITLEANNLLGACVLTVASPGYETAVVPLATPLAPSDGTAAGDQVVNVGLVAPVAPIGGSVFWVDRGVTPAGRVPIDGVGIRTEGDVVVGLAPREGASGVTDPPRLLLAPSPLSTASLGGQWRLDGQVLGRTTYVFEDPRFAPGRLSITLDENGTRQVAAVQQLVATDTGGAIDVELTPRPGRIEANVRIYTVDPNPDDASVQVTAVGPGGPATVAAPAAPGAPFVIDPATPGTWSLTVVPPDRHVVTFGATSFTFTVEPAGTVRLTTELAELSEIGLQVTDATGAAVPGAEVVIEHAQGPISGDPPPLRLTPALAADGTATVFDLPVNLVFPVNAPVAYTVSVAAPGYDASRATFSVDGTPAAIGVLGLDLLAGSKPQVAVRLPRLGTLTSSVIGRLGPDPGAPTETPPAGPPVTVTAERVQDPEGRPQSDTVAAVVQPDGTFTITGPPGYYDLAVTSPDFQPDPVAWPVPDAGPAGSIGPPGTYLLQNDTDRALDPFVLEIEPSTLAVAAYQAILPVPSGPVEGASVELRAGGAVVAAGLTAPDGTVTLGALPGSYTLAIRLTSTFSGEDAAFPLLIPIELRRGSTPAARTTTVVAPLPPIGGAIAGDLGAVNSQGDPVPLPPAVEITRTYVAPDGVVTEGGAPRTVANQATEANVIPIPTSSRTVTPDPAAPSSPRRFAFGDLAAGAHTLTFPAVPGYTAPSPNPRSVVVAGTSFEYVGPVNYIADPVTVVVEVSDANGPVPDATVRLRSPDGQQLVPVASGATFTFSDVAPEISAYALVVTAPLRTSSTTALVVDPDPDGTLTVPVSLTANATQIVGTVARQDDAGGGTSPVEGEGSVTLVRAGAVVAGPVTPGAGGSYEFTATETGTYSVVFELPGYISDSVDVTVPELGLVVDAPPLTVLREATAVVTVTGLGAFAPDLAVSVDPPAGPPARTGGVLTVPSLVPDTTYRLRVSASGYFPVELAPFRAEVGATYPFTVALEARTITVTVTTTPASGDGANALVGLVIGGAAQAPPVGAGNVYTFAAIPAGSGSITVAIPGYRSQTVAVNASSASQNLAVELYANVTVSGTVRDQAGDPVVGATVTALGPGGPISTTSGAGGSYSLAGLGTGSWTIVGEAAGVGSAAVVLQVTATSPVAVTQDIPLG